MVMICSSGDKLTNKAKQPNTHISAPHHTQPRTMLIVSTDWHTDVHMHARECASTHTHKHTHTHTRMHAHTHTHMHVHVQAHKHCTHACTHTHTHTHTHTLPVQLGINNKRPVIQGRCSMFTVSFLRDGISWPLGSFISQFICWFCQSLSNQFPLTKSGISVKHFDSRPYITASNNVLMILLRCPMQKTESLRVTVGSSSV